MSYAAIIYTKKNHIAYITLNRPEVDNIINQQLAQELEDDVIYLRPIESYVSNVVLFADNLLADVLLFNKYHTLLVCLSKDVCRHHPLC